MDLDSYESIVYCVMVGVEKWYTVVKIWSQSKQDEEKEKQRLKEKWFADNRRKYSLSKFQKLGKLSLSSKKK